MISFLTICKIYCTVLSWAVLEKIINCRLLRSYRACTCLSYWVNTLLITWKESATWWPAECWPSGSIAVEAAGPYYVRNYHISWYLPTPKLESAKDHITCMRYYSCLINRQSVPFFLSSMGTYTTSNGAPVSEPYAAQRAGLFCPRLCTPH